MKQKKIIKVLLIIVFVALAVVSIPSSVHAAQDSGSVGLEGRINSAPPKTGATISFPRDGTTVTTLPVNVTGICPTGLLVKIFKNNVFAGSVQCTNGSFSVQIDLFSGRNELVARVYDDLDQAGPDSNVVAVNFPTSGFSTINRVSLTSSFAKRGANPGQTLLWPISLAGGDGPYAITVDWGDGKKPDVISRQFPGTFDISHVYDSPGVYNVVVRAADKNGELAFLQLVAVANGPLSQSNQNKKDGTGGNAGPPQIKILWQPAAIALPLLFTTFWLGKRYELFVLRKRLESPEDIT